MKINIVYCRVSTKGQTKDDKFSLSDQEQFGLAFFASKGLTNVEVIRDQYTGDSTLEERPGGSRLAKLINEDRVASIYLKAPDRLFRAAGTAISFVRVLVDKGIQVYVNGVPRDFTKGEDKFMYNIQAVIGDLERETIILRTSRGRAIHRDMGESIAPLIYGFKKTYTQRGKIKMEIDEVEGPIVVQMFQMRAEGMSVTAIAKRLNESGIPTKKGLTSWGDTLIWRMLKNPVYKGLVKNVAGDLIPSTRYPVLVKEEIWEQAQKEFSSATYVNYYKRSAKPLSGIMRCATCNAPFNYKSMKVPKYNKVYNVYTHNKAAKSGSAWTTYKDCKVKISYLKEDKIEPICAHMWLWAFICTPIQDQVYSELQKKIDLDEAEYRRLAERLDEEHKQVAEKKARIRKAIVVDGMAASFFTVEVKELDAQEERLSKQKLEIEKSVMETKASYQSLRDQFSTSLVTEFIADPRTVYAKTVVFKVVDNERIELWLKTLDRFALWFNPKNPNFLFYKGSYSDEESVDLSYQRIPQLYARLVNGDNLMESLRELGFITI